MENIRSYVISVVNQYQLNVTKYISSPNGSIPAAKVKAEHITRKGIFNYLWMNGELTSEHHEFLWNKYNVLSELEQCIREFREVFNRKNMPALYLFIKNTSIQR